MPKHENILNCLKCNEILIRYNGLHVQMYKFVHDLKMTDKSAHVSCASRGRVDQEVYFQRGASKAHYGQSAHNFGAAVDLFKLTEIGDLSYDKSWFNKIVCTQVNLHNSASTNEPLNWYGAKGSKFFELPHVELLNWKKLNLKLAE